MLNISYIYWIYQYASNIENSNEKSENFRL